MCHYLLDILVLTSYFEGSPNIVKEAISCGLPVISVDVGDVKEQIDGIDNCQNYHNDKFDENFGKTNKRNFRES